MPLFKYRTGAQARVLLSELRIWWASPLSFEDPLDTFHFWTISVDDVRRAVVERVIEYFVRDGNALPEEMDQDMATAILDARRTPGRIPALRAFIESQPFEGSRRNLETLRRDWLEKDRPRLRIFSMSASSDSDGHPNSLPMWEKYADRHRGVVVGFRAFPGRTDPRCSEAFRDPVVYQDTPPVLIEARDAAKHVTREVSVQTDDTKARLRRMVSTKNRKWEFENEWRLWTVDGGDPKGMNVQIIGDEIASVYLGHAISEEDAEEVQNLVERYRGVALFRAQMHEGNDVLVFDCLLPGLD